MSRVQIIRDERNEPIYAVVPWEEYKSLKDGRSEDTVLIERAIVARNDETFPSAVARRLAADEVPLKVIREWRGLAQGQLGSLAGVAPQYISQIERGTRNMGVETARKLAPLLGVSIHALLGDEPEVVAKFAVGQKYRGNSTGYTAEVIFVDPASNGWQACVDVRDARGKLLSTGDQVNFAQFSGSWTLI